MKPREPRESGQHDMFRSRLDQILDMGHEKVILADKIDWRFLSEMMTFSLPSTSRITRQGFVRLTGRELVDRVRSRLSRGEMTPLGESSGAVDSEVLAVVKMTFLIEVIVD